VSVPGGVATETLISTDVVTVTLVLTDVLVSTVVTVLVGTGGVAAVQADVRATVIAIGRKVRHRPLVGRGAVTAA
jgi:hypothetical protein